METFSTLLTLCVGNSPVTGQFPAQRPVTRSFDVFFDLCLNKRLNKQSWGWWYATTSRPLWRHSNAANEYGQWWVEKPCITQSECPLEKVVTNYFYPRPVLAFGYCRCLRVCVCVCLSVNHELVRTITRQPFQLGSPNLDQRCKRPWLRSLLFWEVIDLDLQGQI